MSCQSLLIKMVHSSSTIQPANSSTKTWTPSSSSSRWSSPSSSSASSASFGLTSPGGHRTPWPRSAPQKPSLEPLRRLGARVERVREQRASKGMTRHDPVNFWMFLYYLLYFCYPFEAWNIIVRNIYIYIYTHINHCGRKQCPPKTLTPVTPVTPISLRPHRLNRL